jgi:hypothetical protein
MENKMLLPPKMEKFLNEVTYKVNPNFKIKNKGNKTGWYAFLSFFGKLFNPEIDTRYITVINGECWYPASYFDAEGNFTHDANMSIEILAHETLHEYDRKKWGNFIYTMMYSSPQIFALLALGAIGAIWNSWWLLCLLSLLFLAPIPSPGRALIETRGYRVNVMLERMKSYGDPQAYAEWVADKQFCGPAYFFMFPFRNYIINKLLETEYENYYIYGAIKDWFKLNP